MDAPRVLVVEDDAAIQGFCQIALENEGFLVEAACRATDGLEAFKKARPDLVILDYALPDGTGLELAQRMFVGDAREVPFIFLTARSDIVTRLDCFKSGAQDYIQKPFSVDELLARVKVHLKIKSKQDELVKSNLELKLRERARQDLADMIVHDLKAPLSSIQGTLELVLAQGLIPNETFRTLLQQADSTAEFMLLMVNDLLDIGQAKEARLRAEKTSVDARALFERISSLFAGRVRVSGVTLSLKVEPGAETFETDRNLVFRILVNLIANALKASPSGATVEASVARRGKTLVFAVSDRGQGVPAERKETIFQKYFSTGPRGLTDDSGTGVGLAFCRLAAGALAGTVRVEDRPGGGSTFLLELEKT